MNIEIKTPPGCNHTIGAWDEMAGLWYRPHFITPMSWYIDAARNDIEYAKSIGDRAMQIRRQGELDFFLECERLGKRPYPNVD